MKSLSLEQMEMVQGGFNLIDGINWACIGVAAVGVAASMITEGAATPFALKVAGAFCLGATIGEALPQ